MLPRRLLPDRFAVVALTESVVDGRLVDTETEVATGITGRIIRRRPDEVLRDEAGEIVADADVLTPYRLELGHALRISPSDRWIVTGDPIARRDAGTYRFTSAPIREG